MRVTGCCYRTSPSNRPPRLALLDGSQNAPSHAFAFQAAKASLGYGLVQPRALATHTTPNPLRRQPSLVVMTGILMPTVGLVQASRGGMPAPPRHPARLVPQGGVDVGPHGPPPHLSRRQIEQHGNVEPSLGGPAIRHLPAPDVIGLFDRTLPRYEVRRDRIAMRTGRGDRSTPGATPHRQAGIPHPSPGLRPAHRNAFGVQVFGPPPTPITLPRLRLTRFHPHQWDHCVALAPRGNLLLAIRLKAAATDSQHRTQDRNRPGVLVLADKDTSHPASLATKPRAFLKCRVPSASAGFRPATDAVLPPRATHDRCREKRRARAP